MKPRKQLFRGDEKLKIEKFESKEVLTVTVGELKIEVSDV